MVGGGNTLVTDFLIVAHRLEELGFTYCNGEVFIIGVSEGL
jgi:hypothetical protein